MMALATIGACFGAIAIVMLVLVFPLFIKMRDDLKEQAHQIDKLKTDFADGLQELQAQGAGPDETGIWLPRTDPVHGMAFYKQQDRSAQASDVDELLESLNAVQGRN